MNGLKIRFYETLLKDSEIQTATSLQYKQHSHLSFDPLLVK